MESNRIVDFVFVNVDGGIQVFFLSQQGDIFRQYIMNHGKTLKWEGSKEIVFQIRRGVFKIEISPDQRFMAFANQEYVQVIPVRTLLQLPAKQPGILDIISLYNRLSDFVAINRRSTVKFSRGNEMLSLIDEKSGAPR